MKASALSQMMSQASAPRTLPPVKPTSQTAYNPKRIHKSASNGLFLTETDLYEEAQVPMPVLKPPVENENTMEDMIREIDSMLTGVRRGTDDLAELRRRINKCGRGISKQSAATEGIKRDAKELRSRYATLATKYRSHALLPRIDEENLALYKR